MFHGYTLVFPWPVLCPVCVAPVLAHCKLWLGWWLRDREWAGMTAEASFLSGSEQRQAGRSVKECFFSPTEPAVWTTSQHKPVSQTHNTSTTRPDQERKTEGRGVSLLFWTDSSLFIHPASETVQSLVEVNADKSAALKELTADVCGSDGNSKRN